MAKEQGTGTQRDPGAGQGLAATQAPPAPAPAAATAGERAATQRDTESATRARSARGASREAPDRPSAEELAKRPVKTYRALDRGYVDGRVIEPGEVFSTQAEKGSWMEPVKATKYGVDEAVSDAQAPHPDDINYEGMSQGGLEAIAAMRGVSDPGALDKKDLITAIKAARVPQAQ
jgi:hypothetical protein